jgi:hypothetical protein
MGCSMAPNIVVLSAATASAIIAARWREGSCFG